MNRRDVLRSSALAGTASVAGCLGILEDGSQCRPPIIEDPPDAVYVPTHSDGMEMVGTAESDEYNFALAYTYPHRFWTVTGQDREVVEIREEDAAHLMVVVWDGESDTVVPVDSGLSMEITRDGEPITQKTPWPMLSQNMGFHFGDNFELPDDGTYTATIDVGSLNVRRTGAFADRFDEAETVEIEFEYDEEAKNDLACTELDAAGERGALDPMEMETVPTSSVPAAGDLPGRHVAEATNDSAVFVLTVVEDDDRFVDGDEAYVVASVRTPHNRYPIPMTSLSLRLDRDGETLFEGPLQSALDPTLGYHYGAGVERVESGDTFTLAVESPPQVSRHEGYETAFLDTDEIEIPVQ